MTDEKPVMTKWGPWTRDMMTRLKAALKDEDRDSTIQFEGNEILVSFGNYLVEFLEGEFAKRGHAGL